MIENLFTFKPSSISVLPVSCPICHSKITAESQAVTPFLQTGELPAPVVCKCQMCKKDFRIVNEFTKVFRVEEIK